MKKHDLYETYRELSQELEACQQYLAYVQKVVQQWFDDAYTSQCVRCQAHDSDIWVLLQKQYEHVVPKKRLDSVYAAYCQHIDEVKRRVEVLTEDIRVCQEKLCQIDMK